MSTVKCRLPLQPWMRAAYTLVTWLKFDKASQYQVPVGAAQMCLDVLLLGSAEAGKQEVYIVAQHSEAACLTYTHVM